MGEGGGLSRRAHAMRTRNFVPPPPSWSRVNDDHTTTWHRRTCSNGESRQDNDSQDLHHDLGGVRFADYILVETPQKEGPEPDTFGVVSRRRRCDVVSVIVTRQSFLPS